MSNQRVSAGDGGSDVGGIAARRVPWAWVWVGIVALAAAAATIAPKLSGSPAGVFGATLCLTICLLAAVFDGAMGRIPNALTYTAVLVGLALSGAGFVLARVGLDGAAMWLGAPSPIESLWGLSLCGGIGLACFVLAGMGGGDLKLLAGIGTILGWPRCGMVLLIALAFAVVYSLANLALSGRLNGVLRFVAMEMLNLVFLRQPPNTMPPSRKLMPLAVALFVGVLLSPILTWDWLASL